MSCGWPGINRIHNIQTELRSAVPCNVATCPGKVQISFNVCYYSSIHEYTGNPLYYSSIGPRLVLIVTHGSKRMTFDTKANFNGMLHT